MMCEAKVDELMIGFPHIDTHFMADVLSCSKLEVLNISLPFLSICDMNLFGRRMQTDHVVSKA